MSKNNFSGMSVSELFTLKDKYSKDGDLESLLELAKYRFGRGSIAMHKSIFPELSFLYGVMHRVDELQSFLKENWLPLTMLPENHKKFAMNMAEFGFKYPQIEASDSEYIDKMLKDPEFQETMDAIAKIDLCNRGLYRQ